MEDELEELKASLKEAREFAEHMHELVEWNEGHIDIPWKGQSND